MDDMCSPGLILGLGFSPTALEPLPKPKPAYGGFDLEPTLMLSLSGKTSKERTSFDVNEDDSGCGDSHHRQAVSSPQSGVSSILKAAVKREREASSDDEEDLGGGGSNMRKKLRLTKDQSALLEESFKQHTTLNPKQKQILSRQLSLRPRQVEVWFQNRRARTKLKQTEVDCEMLKKCCETLSDENRRLQKELQELKSLKSAQPLYSFVPAATLTLCPSCERVCGGGGNKSTTKPQFFAHQFTNPSAAC